MRSSRSQPRKVGNGWGGFVRPIQYGDGRNDLVGIDSGGQMYNYATTATGGFGASRLLGTMYLFDYISAYGDQNGDGREEIYTIGPGPNLFETSPEGQLLQSTFRLLSPFPDMSGITF